jgi:hypothetical protein
LKLAKARLRACGVCAAAREARAGLLKRGDDAARTLGLEVVNVIVVADRGRRGAWSTSRCISDEIWFTHKGTKKKLRHGESFVPSFHLCAVVLKLAYHPADLTAKRMSAIKRIGIVLKRINPKP